MAKTKAVFKGWVDKGTPANKVICGIDSGLLRELLFDFPVFTMRGKKEDWLDENGELAWPPAKVTITVEVE